MFFVNLKRRLVIQALMWSLRIVVHFPQSVLITAVFGRSKSDLMKAFVIVGAIASFDDSISPRTCPLDQRVDSAIFFDFFGKGGLAFGMKGIFHRETHGIIRKSYEKGGKLSKARL
jgi:hypothetical protein